MNNEPDRNLGYKVGHWSYDSRSDVFTWSEEVYKLFDWPTTASTPTFANFLALTHVEDRQTLAESAEDLYHKRNDGYGQEVRIGKYNNPESYSWYHIIGKLDSQYIISGVIIDISKRKYLEQQNTELNTQIVEVAKQAWLAEVAVSVIHNIGNILNSATTSASILFHQANQSNLYKFLEIIALLKPHTNAINEFLTSDPKGCQIAKYLLALENNILTETEQTSKEMDNINGCLEHIKSIISSQESISGLCNLREKVLLSKIIESAIKFFGVEINNNNIQINKNYADDHMVTVDYSKLLQVITNLIKNSIDSVLEQNPTLKIITITIQKQPKKSTQPTQFIAISFEDNGVGIADEDLKKLFKFGFTTKPDGHGFGLYNSIEKARELQGDLIVTSYGIGQGATFTLLLPTTLIDNQQDN